MYVVMLVALVMGSVAFSSCGDDEEEDVQTSSIIGTWKAENEMADVVITFKADGTGTFSTNGVENEFRYEYDGAHVVRMQFFWQGVEGELVVAHLEVINNNKILFNNMPFKRVR